jgi:hypothetical protein
MIFQGCLLCGYCSTFGLLSVNEGGTRFAQVLHLGLPGMFGGGRRACMSHLGCASVPSSPLELGGRPSAITCYLHVLERPFWHKLCHSLVRSARLRAISGFPCGLQRANTCLRARGKFKTMVQCRARYRSVESVTLLDSGGPAVSQGQCMAQKTEGGCIAGGLAGYMMKVGDHTEITVIRAWCSANQSERSQVSY